MDLSSSSGRSGSCKTGRAESDGNIVEMVGCWGSVNGVVVGVGGGGVSGGRVADGISAVG